MIVLHWVVFSCCPLSSFLISYLHKARVGSLSINGGKEQLKRAVILEIITQKKLDVVFLQETQ